METSVIAIGWNEQAELNRHFRELEALSCPENTELVAVIGGNDGTYAMYREWCQQQSTFTQVNCLKQEPTDGIAGAIERGVEAAVGEYLLYLESDTGIESNWLTACIERLQEYDAVSCVSTPRNGMSLLRAYQWMNQRRAATEGAPRLSGAQTIGMRREVAEEIILNDPLPRHLVDWHIHRRIVESGYSTGKVESTTVTIRLVDGRTSYDAFRKMQRNSLTDVDDLRTLLTQGVKFGLASFSPLLLALICATGPRTRDRCLIIFLVPLAVSFGITMWDNVTDVYMTSRTDRVALLIAPLYFIAKQVFYLARFHTIIKKLIHIIRNTSL